MRTLKGRSFSRKEWRWKSAESSAKPSRNRHLCLDCGREKFVFKSERAAQMFIEYSRDAMLESNGYAPERVYYCDLCCGWHVTSRRNYTRKNFHREVVDTMIALRRAREEAKKAKQKSSSKPIRTQPT